MSLFTKLVLANSALVVGAVLVLVLTPATVAYPIREIEAFVLIVALMVVIGANWSVTKRITRPLRELSELMAGIDAADDELPAVDTAAADEVATMTASFHAMMGRLEAERASASALALQAQEDERIRVARELHDEVGQTLTALLLQLSMIRQQLSDSGTESRVHRDLGELAESVRHSLDEVRGISARLRPGLLHELGLRAALEDLGRSLSRSGSLTVDVAAEESAALSDEQELAVFRVAQEALTNVARHAGASRATVRLRAGSEAVELSVTDNGSGRLGTPGNGLAGMRERAKLAAGSLTIEAEPGLGTTIRLTIPTSTATSTGAPAKASR